MASAALGRVVDAVSPRGHGGTKAKAASEHSRVGGGWALARAATLAATGASYLSTCADFFRKLDGARTM